MTDRYTYQQAKALVIKHGVATVSFLQRRMQRDHNKALSYCNASSLLNRMVQEGVVSPVNQNRRTVLVHEFPIPSEHDKGWLFTCSVTGLTEIVKTEFMSDALDIIIAKNWSYDSSLHGFVSPSAQGKNYA